MKPNVGDLVLLSWVDIQTHHGWIDADEILPVAECETVGWVIAVGDDAIAIAACKGGDEVNLRMTLPMAVVKKWKVLT